MAKKSNNDDVFQPEKGRLTTLPPLSTAKPEAGGTTRNFAAPPTAGLVKLRDTLIEANKLDLFLQNVPADQRKADGSQWLDTAPEYIDRATLILSKRRDLFPTIVFTPEQMNDRLERTKLLGQIGDQVGSLFVKIMGTFFMEGVDILQLADVVVEELELRLRSRVLDQATRQSLDDLAFLPRKVWQDRMDKVQQSTRDNQRLRTEGQDLIDEANQRAEAAQVKEQIRSGQQVSDAEALSAAGKTLQGKSAAKRKGNRNLH